MCFPKVGSHACRWPLHLQCLVEASSVSVLEGRLRAFAEAQDPFEKTWDDVGSANDSQVMWRGEVCICPSTKKGVSGNLR